MRLYSPVDLTGNLIMIEKLVSGGTWTGDLPIFSPTRQSCSITVSVATGIILLCLIVLKAPGSRLILVGTHQDEMQPTSAQDDENVDKRLQDILYSIKDAEGRAMENIKSEINSLWWVS